MSVFQDHIDEVLGKWHSIDDEIWAKIIVLERNRRVAKVRRERPVTYDVPMILGRDFRPPPWQYHATYQ